MRYRTFPGTELKVSELGFGVWTVSTEWWGVNDKDVRHRLLRKAYEEHGVNFFDTSNTYGDGYGETIMDEALGDVRENIIIATKFGYDLSDNDGRSGHRERRHDFTAKGIRESCEASLKRLNTDYIDMYQSHNPRIDAIDNDEVIKTLEDLRSEGKIRYTGTALGPAIDIRQVEEGLATVRRGYDSVQIIYNLLEQQLGLPILEQVEGSNTGILVRVPHSSGLLEGNLTLDTEFPKWDHRSHRPRHWLVEGLQKIETLNPFLLGGKRTMRQLALKFLMVSPQLMSAFPNVYDEEQLDEFAAFCDVPDLTEDEQAQLAALYAENFGVEPTPVAA